MSIARDLASLIDSGVGITLLGDAVIDGGDILFEGTSFTTTLTYTAPTQANTLTLPDSSGTIALLTDLSGAGGVGAVGGGSDEIFWENDQTVTTNYTITNNKNAGSFGPITVDSGVTVTIGTGETWTIV